MQTIIKSGGLARDAELRSTNDNEVCSFSLGVSQGYGERKSTNWYRCSLWGKRGKALAPYLLKGVKAVVQGELTIGEYQGKPQYDVRVSEVERMSRAEQNGQRTPDGSRGAAAPSQYGGDLDDDIPFARSDTVGGRGLF